MNFFVTRLKQKVIQNLHIYKSFIINYLLFSWFHKHMINTAEFIVLQQLQYNCSVCGHIQLINLSQLLFFGTKLLINFE